VKPEIFGWHVTVPSTRLDIQAGAADLIEDLARVYGYDKLPERLLPIELPEPKGNRSLELEDRVRELLADQGLQEAITYSLSSEEAEAKLLHSPPNTDSPSHPDPLSPGERGSKSKPPLPRGEGVGG
jgi:phenylalanyl-tRNA synthetase beta chain